MIVNPALDPEYGNVYPNVDEKLIESVCGFPKPHYTTCLLYVTWQRNNKMKTVCPFDFFLSAQSQVLVFNESSQTWFWPLMLYISSTSKPHLSMPQHMFELSSPSRDIIQRVYITAPWTDVTQHHNSRQALCLDPPLPLLFGLIRTRGWHQSRASAHAEIWVCRVGTSVGNCTPNLFSSFHSADNYITHLSSGLGRVSGAAGVIPGAQIMGDINQNCSCCHRLIEGGKRRANPNLTLHLSF